MNLTNDEKKLIISILKTHLDQVKKNEKLPSDYAVELAIEAKYEDFLDNIIKKLE